MADEIQSPLFINDLHQIIMESFVLSPVPANHVEASVLILDTQEPRRPAYTKQEPTTRKRLIYLRNEEDVLHRISVICRVFRASPKKANVLARC